MFSKFFESILISFIIVLPFFYEMNLTFRYYFKFFIYYIMLLINSAAVMPIMLLNPGDSKNLLIAAFLNRHISKLLGLKWELRGRRYLEKEQACIIVANHQSAIDILGMFDIWPVMKKCTVVAKKEIFYAWPFGIITWLCGIISIDRMNSKKSRVELNEATNKINEKKIKLWVFPEGTRTNDGEIHSFKKGAFHTAINSQLPILPIVFSSYHFLSQKEKRFEPGHVIITTLPPISTEGLCSDDVESLIAKTRTSMSEIFHKTSQEVKLSIVRRKIHKQ